jgi:hypothetical protein
MERPFHALNCALSRALRYCKLKQSRPKKAPEMLKSAKKICRNLLPIGQEPSCLDTQGHIPTYSIFETDYSCLAVEMD